MKRVLALVIFGGFILGFATQVVAVTLFPTFSQSKKVTVSATVGSSHLSVTGYQSPYASIILKTQNGIFLSSTTTDSKGYFSISNVLINNSVATYCFQAVDFKRIGISESCITIPGPFSGDVSYKDIFLPPTIGLSKKEINAGQDGIIFGYSMPGAVVLLNIEGKVISVTADENGYYTYIYKNVPVGVFTISATAKLGDVNSLAPTNDVTLTSLSFNQQITEEGKKVVEKVKQKVPFDFLPFILLALAFLIAIGILLYKLRLRLWVIIIDFFRRRKKMHHDWFLDHW